jgi:hypothetical protein
MCVKLTLADSSLVLVLVIFYYIGVIVYSSYTQYIGSILIVVIVAIRFSLVQ